MYIIKENTEQVYIIKKSKFICKLYKIVEKEQIEEILDTLKKEYKDATHICYAYVYEGSEKASDDKEPSKTAGIPMLNILKKLNITNTLAVTIRYYGGIKLGAGGLIRAYQNSVKDTITKDNLTEYKKYKTLTLETDFKNEKKLANITKDKKIINKSYNDKIIYKIEIEESLYASFMQIAKNNDINVY